MMSLFLAEIEDSVGVESSGFNVFGGS